VTADDNFGRSVAGAGDVNGDGFADVVVGAIGADPGGRRNAGTASVFHGGPAGIGVVAARVLEGPAMNDAFGSTVAGAGDVNGDGFADIAIGAPSADPSGRMNAGTASVFHGAPAGIGVSAARVLEGAVMNDTFGAALAFSLDVSGHPRQRGALRAAPARAVTIHRNAACTSRIVR
jgi:hypothetical protein